VERPKLGAAFSGGVPDRSSGLSELLAARPRQGSSPAEPTKAPIETEVAPPAQTIKKDPSTRGAKAPAPEGDKVSNVVAYLEGEVYAAVRVAPASPIRATTSCSLRHWRSSLSRSSLNTSVR
jgi:hypothetical protein